MEKILDLIDELKSELSSKESVLVLAEEIHNLSEEEDARLAAIQEALRFVYRAEDLIKEVE